MIKSRVGGKKLKFNQEKIAKFKEKLKKKCFLNNKQPLKETINNKQPLKKILNDIINKDDIEAYFELEKKYKKELEELLKEDSIKEAIKKKAFLRKYLIDINIIITGGLADNLHFLNYYLFIDNNINYCFVKRYYEAGQTNLNLLKFYLPKRLLNNIKFYNSYEEAFKNCYFFMDHYKNKTPIVNELNKVIFNSLSYKHKHKKYYQTLLLNPLLPYNIECKNIIDKIKNNDYGLIGIRWLYPHGRLCKFSLMTIKQNLANYEKLLNNYNKVVIMCDDYRFLKLFKIIFYDLLINKEIITLKNIDVNNVHESIKIASLCKTFTHNYSGFYDLIDVFFYEIYKDNYSNNSFINAK